MISRCSNTATYLANVKGLFFYGGRLEEVCNCYFNHPNIATFYTIDSYANMQILGKTATICGEIENVEEINSFINFMDIQEVYTNNDNLLIEGFKKTKLSIMAFCGQNTPPNEQYTVKEISPLDLVGLWKNEYNKQDIDNMYSDLCMRKNYTGAKCFGIYKEDVLLSVAACVGHGTDELYLSFVYTDKAYRNNGTCKILLNTIAEKYSDKCTYLTCEKNLVSFYEKCEFQKQGEQYLLEKIHVNT